MVYLSGMLVVVASSAEQDATTSATTGSIATEATTASASASAGTGKSVNTNASDITSTGSDARECPSPSSCECECTVTEFENLQTNLDSCLTSNDESDKHTQRQKDEIASLSSTIEKMSIEEAKWDKERKELHILINDLQKTIDTKTENETTLTNVQKEFEQQIQKLESEIHSMTASHEENSLTKEKDVSEAKTVATECQSHLLELSSKYEEALKKVEVVEKKQSKASNNYTKRVGELRNQISKITKDLDQKNKSFRALQDKHHDAREDVTNLDRELRMMHIRAQKTYFNSTLVMEDTMHFFYRMMDKSVIVAEDLINHPRVQAAYSVTKSKVDPIVEPIIPMYKKNVLPKMVELGNKMKEIDAIEGVRLTLISMIEQGSTIGLNYIELTKDQRFRPRRFQSKASRVLNYATKNSEYIVHTAFQLFVVYLGFKFLSFVFKMIIFMFQKLVRVKRTGTNKSI